MAKPSSAEAYEISVGGTPRTCRDRRHDDGKAALFNAWRAWLAWAELPAPAEPQS